MGDSASPSNHYQPFNPKHFGLPETYTHELDSRNIPTQHDMREVIPYALDELTAFLMLHKHDPDIVAQNLDRLVDVLTAAMAIKGQHMARAIRLGLCLEYPHWRAAKKIEKWRDLLAPMLGYVFETPDVDLQSQVYHTWGVYLHLTNKSNGAAMALEKALEYAKESGRAEPMLIMRAESLNARATTSSLAEVRQEAQSILESARQLNLPHVQGRVHLSLARAYLAVDLPDHVFEHAQQALGYFFPLEIWNFAGEALLTMISGLLGKPDPNLTYRRSLMLYLQQLARQSDNLWLNTISSHQWAVEDFNSGNYPSAREYLLKTWDYYRLQGDLFNQAVVRHTLGLIQMKLQRWILAETHLHAARALYKQLNRQAAVVNVYHALALVLVYRGAVDQGVRRLKEALDRAQTLEDPETRAIIGQRIQDDINTYS